MDMIDVSTSVSWNMVAISVISFIFGGFVLYLAYKALSREKPESKSDNVWTWVILVGLSVLWFTGYGLIIKQISDIGYTQTTYTAEVTDYAEMQRQGFVPVVHIEDDLYEVREDIQSSQNIDTMIIDDFSEINNDEIRVIKELSSDHYVNVYLVEYLIDN